MLNQIVRRAFVLTAFLCVAAFAGVGGRALASENAKPWVSVDANELGVVAASAKMLDSTMPLDAGIARVVDGIAILQLDDEQMEDLSRGMHDNFHKCGGFVEHATEADAVAWIQRSRSVDNESPTVVYTINNQATVNTLFSLAREADNRQTILDLSAFPNRRYNQPSGLESANWIKNKWTNLAGGRGNVTVDFFNHPSNVSPQPSVIMTIAGSRFPNEVVVVGAHQDSINQGGATLSAPGADDDASGIACLTEMIRVLFAKNFRPERTVKFMAYAAEEVGLRGSDAIAASFRAANTNVIGVMQLDMTNYKGSQGNDIVIITDFTNAAQNQFVRDLITAYQPTLVMTNAPCGYACSDHASWNNRSYPASFPFEAPIGDDNPFIHTANDTISQSGNNANQAVKFTKLGLSYVAELAKGCISRRVPCSAIYPDRPAALPAMKFTSTTETSGSSLFGLIAN